MQTRLKKFVGTGQLGIFAGGYWGHPAYKLPPEVNLLAVSHYLEALDWQRDVIRLHTIFGGKNPHPNFLVGGMASAINVDSTATINAERIADLSGMIKRAREFVEQVYWPDLVAIAGFYKDWGAIGGGVPNFLACGEFPEADVRDLDKLYFPRGIILDKDLTQGPRVRPEEGRGIHPQLLVRVRRRARPGCTRTRARRRRSTPDPRRRGRTCRMRPSTRG